MSKSFAAVTGDSLKSNRTVSRLYTSSSISSCSLGFQRGSDSCFLTICPENVRDAPTLTGLIKQWILPGTTVAGEALSSYNRVHRDFGNRPDTSISLSKFLKQKRIPERSFYRKKKIAELIILDRPRFDSLIKQILKEERTDRINQQILSDRCGTIILKQGDFLEKKRLAIAAGKIL